MIRYLFQRWKNRKTWWVCEYKIKSHTDSYIEQSGKFAEFGENREDAQKNALEYIQKTSYINGVCEYVIRRPNLLEIFNL